MGTRTSHPPGTISWTDLSTTDYEASTGFFAGLLGWTYEENPTDIGPYAIARRDGHDVAAIFQGDGSLPPHWNTYVTVESADATAARAKELGGSLMMEPFDVMDVGRMCAIQDPQGAVICAWEPRAHIGAGLVNAPGALTWNELLTSDPGAGMGFYSALFGWGTKPMAELDGYTTITVGDRSNGGVRQLTDEMQGMPPHWSVCFGIEDVDAGAAKAAELGGQVLVPPEDMTIGRFAVLADPAGAAVAIYAGIYDD